MCYSDSLDRDLQIYVLSTIWQFLLLLKLTSNFSHLTFKTTEREIGRLDSFMLIINDRKFSAGSSLQALEILHQSLSQVQFNHHSHKRSFLREWRQKKAENIYKTAELAFDKQAEVKRLAHWKHSASGCSRSSQQSTTQHGERRGKRTQKTSCEWSINIVLWSREENKKSIVIIII